MNNRAKVIIKTMKLIDKQYVNKTWKTIKWSVQTDIMVLDNRIDKILTLARFLSDRPRMNKIIFQAYRDVLTVQETVDSLFESLPNGFVKHIPVSNYFEATYKEMDKGKFDEIMYWDMVHVEYFEELVKEHVIKMFARTNSSTMEIPFK